MTLGVPDDLAVEALLPLLAEACGADRTATWALVPRGGVPIEARRTLREAGIWPGAVLALRLVGAGEQPRPPVLRAVNLPDLSGPRPPWRRLGAALAAAVGGETPATAGGALARSRAAWRAGGRVALLERALAAAPRGRGVVIAVGSVEPGCGKTTVAALLAALLSQALPEPPLAVDADAESRSLTLAVAPDSRVAQSTYAAVVGLRLRLGDLPRVGASPGGIALLPAPALPGPAPEAAACAALIERLRADWAVILLDCPAGFTTPWARAAWAGADQFVLVAPDGHGGLPALAPAAGALVGAGVAVAVVANRAGRRGRSARAAAALPAPVVALPDDPAAAALLRGGELTWETAPAGWRTTVAELAAALALRWGAGTDPLSG